MIRHQVGLDPRARRVGHEDDQFVLVALHSLNLLCARHVDAPTTPPTSVISEANATGQALFTRTVLDGRSAMRFSIGRTAEHRTRPVHAGVKLRRRGCRSSKRMRPVAPHTVSSSSS